MSSKKDCITIIPVYKALEVNDIIAIRQAINMTLGIDVVFIMPESFITDESFIDFVNIPIERFEDSFFANILGYNRLMLNVDFYRRFSDYKYMLVHQTDAFLFKPELQYWCDKDYDYIGAPWLKPHKLKKAKFHSFLLNVCPWIFSHQRKMQIRYYNNVGNGGLSLRKIETFINILESENTQSTLSIYLANQISGIVAYNEDIFWGLEGPMLHNNFKKPDWHEAMYFALEKCPTYAYNLMNKQLPFGCHAPLTHEFEFWQDYIPFTKSK